MSQKKQNLRWLLASIRDYYNKKPKRQCITTADCIYYRANDSKLADTVANIQGTIRRGHLPEGMKFFTKAKLNKLRARCCGCSDGATASQKSKERALAEQSINQFRELAKQINFSLDEGVGSSSRSTRVEQRVVRKNPML